MRASPCDLSIVLCGCTRAHVLPEQVEASVVWESSPYNYTYYLESGIVLHLPAQYIAKVYRLPYSTPCSCCLCTKLVILAKLY